MTTQTMKFDSKLYLLLVLIHASTPLQAQSALKKVTTFLKHASSISAIWPGFIDAFHHGIYEDNGDMYLALQQQAPEGWQRVKTVNDVPIWHKQQAGFKALSAEFILGHPLTPDIQVDAVNNNQDAIPTLFHESFHQFQNSLVVPETDWSDIDITDRQHKIKQKEFALLHQIMKTKSAQWQTAKNSIILYNSIRKYRETLMNQTSADLERAMEWQEGVAAYIEYEVKDILAKRSSFGTLLNDFGAHINIESKKPSLENFMRSQAYFHGAAICQILKHSNPDWQRHIEQGKTPFALLLSTYGSLELTDEEVNQALKFSPSDDNKSITQQRFDDYLGWKFAIEIRNNAELSNFSFNAIDTSTFANGIHVDTVNNISYSHENLTISGKPLALFLNHDSTDKEHIYLKVRKIPKKPKSCQALSKTQWQCPAGSKIRGSGLKIIVNKDTTIILENGRLILEP